MKFAYFALIFTSTVCAQAFDQSAFIKKVRTGYHSFNVDTTTRIESQLNTLGFNRYVSTKTTEPVEYPITINWSKVNQIQLNKRELSLEASDITEQQNYVLLLTNLFLQNWLEFSVNELIPMQAINYNFNKQKDRVFFSYVLQNGNKFDRVAKEFGLNGLLVELKVQTADRTQLHIQPIYRSVLSKWLCVGWTYQKIDEHDTVVEGMKVDLVQRKIGQNWYPYDVYLTIQSQASKNQIINEQLYFRHYTLNGNQIN